MSPELVRCWFDAAAQPAIRIELETIYEQTADEIERRGPACWASGRCCNFRTAGHLLFVTGLETAYTLGALATPEQRAAARQTDPFPPSCPLQASNLCGVHPVRPLGCRIYFCDATAQEWQHELSERMLRAVRDLHDRWDIPYRYGEWRRMLRELASG